MKTYFELFNGREKNRKREKEGRRRERRMKFDMGKQRKIPREEPAGTTGEEAYVTVS